MSRKDIRLALPSKGRLAQDAVAFLEAAGLKVYRPNPRQYEATIPTLPELTVMFQRPGDIAVSVRQGSVDFGITGLDVFSEKAQAWVETPASNGETGDQAVLILHDALDFSHCRLSLAVPEAWKAVQTITDLAEISRHKGVRIATKFPALTGRFLDEEGVRSYELVEVEGTLEIAPAIGYADLIADLVSTGTTLRDNHLREVEGGVILHSQAILIANRHALQERPEVLAIARELIEYIEAHLRAEACHLVFANMRGDSPEEIAARMFNRPALSGLQGPTISPVFPNNGHEDEATGWYAVNIVVRKDRLAESIAALRAVGGSGVVVAPVTYIFEEEPARYRSMLAALED
ncbi:MAG: ATP phosphoribosyltransferase [Candidatus Promineifilaceae bacterium]|nr:ATP phosphoribosyltransferase [Candidatus Promineifilaceae bacterium]